MKEEVIIGAARKYEKSTGFGDIVLRARGVNSAAGIGFLEGAVWMQEQMMDKACKWLENVIDNGAWIANDVREREKAAIIAQFKEDMEDEK